MNERSEAISTAMSSALNDNDGGEGFTVFACLGPPQCSLVGDEAEAAQRAGCTKCEIIIISATGAA